jgi:hypothetical protein
MDPAAFCGALQVRLWAGAAGGRAKRARLPATARVRRVIGAFMISGSRAVEHPVLKRSDWGVTII